MSRRRPPRDERGMILVNVLMFVAIAAGMVLLMVNREELALNRGLRDREAARALAVARGGEISALVALRRDLRLAPQVDHVREPWAALAETGVPIEGGSFDLAIADAEGRFNVNSVRSGEAASVILFQTIANTIGVPGDKIEAAIQYIRLEGPVSDLRPLALLGLDAEQFATLTPLMTALPGTTTINLNAASEELLALLFRDPLVANRLVRLRARQGYITPADLAAEHATLPWGTSFRSSTFWVRTGATIGGTRQQVATLIRREVGQDGQPQAYAVERWRNAAIPAEAPGFVTR